MGSRQENDAAWREYEEDVDADRQELEDIEHDLGLYYDEDYE